MQYLNDDMDELFRKAAEGYPLNTNAANWEKVNAMLSPQEEPELLQQNKRTYMLWLLLLPLTFICNHLTDGNPLTTGTKPAEVIMSSRQAQAAKTNIRNEKKATVNATKAGANRESTIAFLPNDNDSKTQHIAKRTNRQDQQLFPALQNASNVNVSRLQNEMVKSDDTEKSANATNNQASKEEPVAKIETSKSENNISQALKENTGKENDAISANQATDKAQTRKSNLSTGRQKRFYAGVVAAPDISTVKFQKFSNVGFEAGVVIGYTINKRFAIEAGSFTAKKYYYSEGEYFNTAKVYMPANSKIIAVDGNCRMIELPIDLQYTFNKKQKHSWFGSAGLSSYLMKSENYRYDYLYLTSGNVVSYHKTYTNQSKNWFSALQLSVGYTSQLGAVGDLRIAPYYAIPLKGMGYGSLPVSSIGIHIGIISKRF